MHHPPLDSAIPSKPLSDFSAFHTHSGAPIQLHHADPVHASSMCTPPASDTDRLPPAPPDAAAEEHLGTASTASPNALSGGQTAARSAAADAHAAPQGSSGGGSGGVSGSAGPRSHTRPTAQSGHRAAVSLANSGGAAPHSASAGTPDTPAPAGAVEASAEAAKPRMHVQHALERDPPETQTTASSHRHCPGGAGEAGGEVAGGPGVHATAAPSKQSLQGSADAAAIPTTTPGARTEADGEEGSFLHMPVPFAALKGVRNAQNPMGSVSATSAVSDAPFPPDAAVNHTGKQLNEVDLGSAAASSWAAEAAEHQHTGSDGKRPKTPRFWGRLRGKSKGGSPVAEGVEAGASSSGVGACLLLFLCPYG